MAGAAEDRVRVESRYAIAPSASTANWLAVLLAPAPVAASLAFHLGLS